MVNKEIYIDGVDVSGCYELFNGCCCDNGSFYCSGQPNCQFKLEKRGYKLEQITEFTPREELIETITHLRVLNAELESYNEQLKESQDIEIKQNKNLREQLKRKEQECEELKNERTVDLVKQLDQLKAEVKSKTEYIQEQRDIINQYSKEIEMYKKCQGKRASKREEELKAENEILKEKFEIAIKNNMDKTLLRLEKGDVQEELQEIREQFGIETLYCHVDNTRVHRCLDVLKLKDTLTEIKEIAEKTLNMVDYKTYFKRDNKSLKQEGFKAIDQILQKISECEGNND